MIGASPREIERLFYSRKTVRSLKQREIDHFIAAGVAPLDLAFPDMLNAARVQFERDGSFLFADEMRDPLSATVALILLCRDDLGDAIDIVAWQPSTNRVVRWLKRAWTIEEDFVAEILESGERRLPVFRSPMEWLRNSRQGVVILDAAKARWAIASSGLELVAEDVPHGRCFAES